MMENTREKSSIGIVFIIIILFIIITLLSLYLLNIISIPSFFGPKSPSALKQIDISESESQPPTGGTSSTTIIAAATPQTFTNNATSWLMKPIPNSEIKVTSALEINTNVQVNFENDAPLDSSTGIVFDNGLPEKDPNFKRMNFFYFLKDQIWTIRFRSGETSEYFYVSSMKKDEIAGTFSLSIAADGKSVLVTASKKTKVIDFPSSLYETSNQMRLSAQVGPNSALTISSLSYNTKPQ